jgi:hypothetical protein
MAVSGGRLYIGGTFKTANGVTRSALAAVDPVTGALSNDVNLAFTGPRAFTGTTLGAPSTVAAGVDWSTGRPAFVVGGRLYTGHADGAMTVRDFDGATASFITPIALNGLTSTQFPISRISGMFFWNGRLYYTLSGDTRLYYRWFIPESGVIGADTFVASGAGDGRNWSTVSGMTMASGRLVYATPPAPSPRSTSRRASHRLRHRPQRPGRRGQSWQSRGLFVLNLPT